MNAATDTNTIEGAITEVKGENPMATFNPTQYAAAALEPFKKQLASAKRQANKASFDITTREGMKEAKGLRATFREIRTGVESARKEAKAPIIEAGQKVDAVAKELTAEVRPFEDKYTGMIEEEEARIEAEKQAKIAAERARIEAIEQRIAHIRGMPQAMAQADSATIDAKLGKLVTKRLEPALYDDQLEDAINALNATIDALTGMYHAALAREEEARRVAAERAELARLKAEQEAREKAEREAAAERERAAQAERDRIEAERRAAAEREADLLRQLAEMKAQMAAAQPQPEVKAPPANDLVQVPTITEGDAVVMGVDLAEPDADHSVEIVAPLGDLLDYFEAPATAPELKRPSDEAIADVVAKHFDVSRDTAIEWIKEFSL